MAEQPKQLHQSSIIIDSQVGANFDFGALKGGGVTAFNYTLTWTAESAAETMPAVAQALDLDTIFPGEIMQVERVEDIERAKQDNKVGIIFGLQGMALIGRGLHWVRILHKLGVRIGGIVYNESGVIGCSCAEPTDSGLTFFGRQVVNEMNRLGMVIDLSHSGDRTSMDAVNVSSTPVIISHSNPRRLVNHPRNVPDDLMKAVASRGGVIGLANYRPLLDSGEKAPTVDKWLDHIDYVVNLVGIDHVGIGTDADVWSRQMWISYMIRYKDLVPQIAQYMRPDMLDHNTHNIEGFADHRDLPKITDGLLRRGYAEDAVQKILGQNFLRVFREVW
ncbi:MAG TPA: membrane dipeptidase [Nitrospirota bacterium]|nr:membrane dipeptidase [Nitrospirota bacterium]